jgi:hypothetical protein
MSHPSRCCYTCYRIKDFSPIHKPVQSDMFSPVGFIFEPIEAAAATSVGIIVKVLLRNRYAINVYPFFRVVANDAFVIVVILVYTLCPFIHFALLLSALIVSNFFEFEITQPGHKSLHILGVSGLLRTLALVQTRLELVNSVGYTTVAASPLWNHAALTQVNHNFVGCRRW